MALAFNTVATYHIDYVNYSYLILVTSCVQHNNFMLLMGLIKEERLC